MTTTKQTREEKFARAVGTALANGHTIPQVVQTLLPIKGLDEEATKVVKRRRKRMRSKLHAMAAHDEIVRTIIAEHVTGQMVAALPEITAALIKRAKRGRPDAIKLIFEATGYYNPKIKHEHSGDIKITLDIPRPVQTVEQFVSGEEPVDADVVDDGDS